MQVQIDSNFYPRPPRGGRLSYPQIGRWTTRISIHALREEGDDIIQDYVLEGKKFLSTPSARRATAENEDPMDALEISIHALREEGDIYIVDGTPVLDGFLSTPSARRATLLLFRGSYLLSISIHALREEGDRRL